MKKGIESLMKINKSESMYFLYFLYAIFHQVKNNFNQGEKHENHNIF